MKTNKTLCNTAVFLGLIGILTLGNLVSPKKTFSENENRMLAKAPELTVSSIFGGNFDDNFEKWFSDHFVGRDGWIGAKSFFRHHAGAIENNDVYYAHKDVLIRRFPSVNHKIVNANLLLLEEFADTTGIRPNMVLIPTAVQSDAELLPWGAFDVDQKALLDDIYHRMPYADTVDLTTVLENNDSYFRTDHHWNAQGAARAYETIAKTVLGKEPNAFTTTVVSTDFYGTMYSRSGAFWVEPDAIERIDPIGEIAVHLTYEDGTESDSLFFDNRLEEKDQYQYYLDGNHARITITTSMNTTKKAVVVKDSYAHILLPYLVSEYAQLEVIDLRYYHDSVSELVDADTDVYFIYNLENFCEDPNMVFLK